jgi:glutaminyl-peptide cyclotransferase
MILPLVVLLATPVQTYKIKNTYPHDRSAFTQGLVYADGILYESTGLRGRSSVRRVTLETGSVLSQTSLLPEYFGEGIAVFGDRIYQLTWTTGVGFIYDKKSLSLLQEFRYGTEGWGMTHDGKCLIVSDGSAILYFWDPKTLREVKRLQVTDEGKPIENLNELEIVEGEILANVWQQDRIARISPETGKVLGWIDMKGILSPADRRGGEDVLNGIAYDAEKKRLFVTGKQWPKLYEIEIVGR